MRIKLVIGQTLRTALLTVHACVQAGLDNCLIQWIFAFSKCSRSRIFGFSMLRGALGIYLSTFGTNNMITATKNVLFRRQKHTMADRASKIFRCNLQSICSTMSWPEENNFMVTSQHYFSSVGILWIRNQQYFIKIVPFVAIHCYFVLHLDWSMSYQSGNSGSFYFCSV